MNPTIAFNCNWLAGGGGNLTSVWHFSEKGFIKKSRIVSALWLLAVAFCIQ